MMKTYKFKAEIKKYPKVNAAFIEFPYSVEEEFGTKGQVKVRVEFNGYEYCGSLAKMGIIVIVWVIPQEIRKAIGKEPGDIIQVVLKKTNHQGLLKSRKTLPHCLIIIWQQKSILMIYPIRIGKNMWNGLYPLKKQKLMKNV